MFNSTTSKVIPAIDDVDGTSGTGFPFPNEDICLPYPAVWIVTIVAWIIHDRITKRYLSKKFDSLLRLLLEYGQTFNQFHIEKDNKRKRTYTYEELKSIKRRNKSKSKLTEHLRTIRRSHLIEIIYNSFQTSDYILSNQKQMDLQNIIEIIILYSHNIDEIEFYETLINLSNQMRLVSMNLQLGCRKLVKINVAKSILRTFYVAILIFVIFTDWVVTNEENLNGWEQFKGYCAMMVQSCLMNFVWIAERIETKKAILLANVDCDENDGIITNIHSFEAIIIEKLTLRRLDTQEEENNYHNKIAMSFVKSFVQNDIATSQFQIEYKMPCACVSHIQWISKFYAYHTKYLLRFLDSLYIFVGLTLLLPVCLFVVPVYLVIQVIIVACLCLNIDVICHPSKYFENSVYIKRLWFGLNVAFVQIEFFVFVQMIGSNKSFSNTVDSTFQGKYCQTRWFEACDNATFGELLLLLAWMFL